MGTDQTTTASERDDLLAALAKQRHFLRFTLRGLTDQQATQHPTVSELCLSGIVKHVAEVESGWVDFILDGPSTMDAGAEGTSGGGDAQDWLARFRVLPGESMAGLLERYEETARRTDEVVATYPDLGTAHPLPDAPWFEKGTQWSARRVLLHIIAETAQHAGHADIIRESLDGAKTMG
jgi:uncharacterized damage-inducible protein DinB